MKNLSCNVITPEQNIVHDNHAVTKLQMMSHVSATIPWEEGSEEDFKELREGLEALRRGMLLGGGGDSETDSSEEEEDEDPGEGRPGERLLWAAQYNKLELVKSLLSTQPDLVHHCDSDRYTALHRAAYSDHYEVVDFLLEAGADPLAVTEDGWTALHSAARWNCARCVERLVLVVPVNSLTKGGQTPLHLTSQSNNRETLELLLAHPDIDPTITNSQVGLSSLARCRGHIYSFNSSGRPSC